jgi:hypothetical protein
VRLAILLLIIIPFQLFSQIIGLINYTVNEGLSSNTCYTLFQDHKGNIWVGSDNGPSRFDGKEFTVYNEKDGLKDIEVLGFRKISNNRFIFWTLLNNLSIYDDGKIINENALMEFSKIKLNDLSISAYDSIHKTLYLISSNAPKSYYSIYKDKILEHPIDFEMTSHCHVADDHLIYKNRNGFFNYNFKGKYSKKMNFEYKNSKLTRDSSFFFEKNYAFIIKNSTVIIFKTEDKFSYKEIASISIPLFTLSPKLAIDRNNMLWVYGSGNGAYHYHCPMEKLNKYTQSHQFLIDKRVNDILVDKDDNVWFTTNNDGIFFLADVNLNNYLRYPLIQNPKFVSAIAHQNKEVIIGYGNSKIGVLENHIIQDINISINKYSGIRSIFNDGNDIYFMNDFNLFLLKNKQHLFKIKDDNSLPKAISASCNDKLLLNCGQGGFVMNKKNLEIHQIFSKRSYSGAFINEDSVFIGTPKGLYKVDIHDGKNILFEENKIGSYFFNDIKNLNDSLFIGGTNAAGIVIFSKDKVCKIISKENGLAHNNVKQLVVQNDSTFWACTPVGINSIIYNFKNNNSKVKYYSKLDGLPSNNTTCATLVDSNLFVGTDKGIGLIQINNIGAYSRKDYNIFIQSITVNEKKGDFTLLQKLNDDSSIKFKISYLDYASIGNIKYYYMLEGLHKRWIETPSNEILFQSLPPGDYTLLVYGINNKNERSEKKVAFEFTVRAHFWQTVYFKLLCTCLALFLLYYISKRWLIKSKKKEIENLSIEKKIIDLELQAIKAQINPHFIYNCLNSIQYLNYNKKNDDVATYIDLFSKLIRKTLNYSQTTLVTIEEEKNYLINYLMMENLRFKGNLLYEITSNLSNNNNYLLPSFLIQPFVENALKHGFQSSENGLVKINFQIDHQNDKLIITILDNGIGINVSKDKKKESANLGIKLSNKRIQTLSHIYNVTINIELLDSSINSESGTIVTISIFDYNKLMLNLPLD